MNNNTEVAIEKLLDTLKKKEWKIVLKNKRQLSLSESISARYPKIPADYLLFLSMIGSCSDQTGKIWFLTEAEYNRQGVAPIAWDFCEALTLEAIEEYGHPEETGEIKEFWDGYMPILLSAKSEYAYLAIGVHAENFGQIIGGFEPEFEESAKEVCKSFTEFCSLYSKMMEGQLYATSLLDFI